ncbi:MULTISPECIES: response regulator [unclassified Nocardioides]|uniref:response regulator transcription factor n=1 Tax=unclassified Nocardioides TaxID=2615069 RepID=UPI000057185D|nr:MULTISPECIES: response regulator [unclassified Nocardioides]ABL82763.1 response regulator receiver [Nocardioides sp. JS614]
MSEVSVTQPVALVIDDDQDTVDLLEVLLSQAGFGVVTATNGPDGIALALEHRPALATIDVTMPEMDGLEVTRRVREATPTYIVIISSRSQEHDVLAGFDAGADDYIPKPIRPRELQARLAAVARRPIASVTGGPTATAWAPAAEDAARSEYLRLVVSGEAVGFDHEDEAEGQDGRDGMLELGMRFVGSWIEFHGLRINPARDLLVIDDLIVDALPEQIKLIETMLYAGTLTLTARQLALRYRGESEEAPTRGPEQDRKWFDAEIPKLLIQIGDDAVWPRWFRVNQGTLQLVDRRV